MNKKRTEWEDAMYLPRASISENGAYKRSVMLCRIELGKTQFACFYVVVSAISDHFNITYAQILYYRFSYIFYIPNERR